MKLQVRGGKDRRPVEMEIGFCDGPICLETCMKYLKVACRAPTSARCTSSCGSRPAHVALQAIPEKGSAGIPSSASRSSLSCSPVAAPSTFLKGISMTPNARWQRAPLPCFLHELDPPPVACPEGRCERTARLLSRRARKIPRAAGALRQDSTGDEEGPRAPPPQNA